MSNSHPLRGLTARTAAGLFLLLSLPLAAQRSGPLDDARRGEGEIELRAGETVPIVEAAVTLRPDGTVTVVAASRRERYELRGTWRQGDREQRLMTIERALGEAANAEGWVISNEGRLRRIEIIGRWSGGKKLRLSFLATADLPPGAPVWDGVDSTRPGEGTLERDRGTRLVRRVRVVLAADGRAEIVVTSFGEFRLAGRWTAESATRVRFVATGGLSGEPGEGGGTIDLRDREVERVALTGRSGSLDYRIDFRAGAEPPPVAPRPGREELTEEPGFNLEGGDYTSVYFETLRECQGACRRDERCRAYTYNTRSRTCYLKDRAGRYERREDTVSGVKDDGR